jgi:hypothetical protein
MSAVLWVSGVVYLLLVNHQVGKRYDADFNAWQYRMHDATVATALNGKGTFQRTLKEPERLNIATAIQKALEP